VRLERGKGSAVGGKVKETRIQETEYRRQNTGDRIQETGDRRQNTENKRVESFRVVYSAFGVGSASQQFLGSRLLYSVFRLLYPHMRLFIRQDR